MEKYCCYRLFYQSKLPRWMTGQASFETKPTNPVKLDIP
jgi:hypothetical protein